MKFREELILGVLVGAQLLKSQWRVFVGTNELRALCGLIKEVFVGVLVGRG